jgi:outer membrane protein assembly factor BamB
MTIQPMKTFPIRSILVLACVVSVPLGSLATMVAADNDWPQFRGRDAGVAANNPRLPATWDATKNVVWTTGIPGLGWSSPIVSGDHVFVTAVVTASDGDLKPKPGLYNGGVVTTTSAAEHRWVVYDVALATGKVRWQREIRRALPGLPKHQKNSYASETPVTDGTRVYVLFGGVGLYALNFEGQVVWSKAFADVKFRNGWGSGASPVLHRGRLYVVCDNDTQSFVVAFDAETGRELWKVNRQEGTNWSTPFVWEHDQRTELVTTGSDKVRSYDLNGTLLWELAGMSTITIPTPFARHGLLFISSGYVADKLRPTYAIKPGASGDISLAPGTATNAFVAWSDPGVAPYNPTPLAYGDVLYTLLDRGFFTAHDARTGREIYGRQRIASDASGFTSSPWAYNDKIFVMSEDGDTYVLQPGPEFKILGKNSLGEMTLATPAVSDDSLIVRTASRLYRISER